MTAQPLPFPPLRHPALREVAARWPQDLQSGPLPDGLVEWTLGSLQARLDGTPPPAAMDGHGPMPPADWPPADALDATFGALDALLDRVLQALLASDQLDAQAVSSVHQVGSTARSMVLAHALPRGQSLQQALVARDRQLSIATHELRTPISSILLNLQMLERTAASRGSLDQATVTRLLQIPSRQLRRLMHMVDLLLDTAQVESERLVLDLHPVDLCEVAHDVVARLEETARAAGRQLAVTACEPLVGDWDRLRLEQVLHNLLTNAIKYGGPLIGIRVFHDGETRLAVTDGGPGIAPEDQPLIFEPFKRLPSAAGEDGAGLGLYIVREIVRAHGGRIDVDSRPGEGATFTVTLPGGHPLEPEGGDFRGH